MKNTVRILALMLVLVMSVMLLVSCSTYGTIKKDFEEAGYTLQNEDNEKTGEIETEDGVITYTIHSFQKEGSGILGSITQGLSTAVIWEFSSDKDLAKAMAENEDMMEALEKAQESELVNGNCFLITINPDAIEIFNQSK
jgi:major membrane immunogen (membrane-anchored lipoprotein)